MAKKKKNKLDFNVNIMDSLKQIEDISNETINELKKLTDEMLDIAKDVKKDYKLDTDALNDMSSSLTRIHEASPYLDEIFQGDSWKKVLKTDLPVPPLKETKKEDKDDK